MNRYGNVWYQVMSASGEGYVYSEKTREHHCSFRCVDGCDNVFFCRCGNITVANDNNARYAVSVGYTDALPVQDLLGAETLEALRLALTGVGAAAAAAFPYIAVVAVGGMLIYLTVTATDGTVTLDRAAVDYRELGEKYKPDSGKFYNGIRKNSVIFINVADPMDEGEALMAVDYQIGSYLNILTDSARSKLPLWFIYTFWENDAYQLAADYCFEHADRQFFIENLKPDEHHSGNCMAQFKHIHIVSNYLAPGDHFNGHILFGTPCLDTFRSGAWA